MSSRHNKRKKRREKNRGKKQPFKPRPQRASQPERVHPQEEELRDHFRKELAAGASDEDLEHEVEERVQIIVEEEVSQNPGKKYAVDPHEYIRGKLTQILNEERALHRLDFGDFKISPEDLTIAAKDAFQNRMYDDDLVVEEVKVRLQLKHLKGEIAQLDGRIGGLLEEFEGSTEGVTIRYLLRFIDRAKDHLQPETYDKFHEAVTKAIERRRQHIWSERGVHIPVQMSATGDKGTEMPSGAEDIEKIFKMATQGLSQKERDAVHASIEDKLDELVAKHERGENISHEYIDFNEHIDAVLWNNRREDRRNVVVETGPELTQKRAKPEESSVDAYMEAMQVAYNMTKPSSNGNTTKERITEAVRLWNMLRDARVFHVDHETFQAVYTEVDRYTTEEVAGLEYQPPSDPPIPLPEGDSERHVRALTSASRHASYPEKFPFPCVFLGYGGGVAMREDAAFVRAPADLRPYLQGLLIRGHIMTADGSVDAVLKGWWKKKDGQLQTALWFEPIRMPDYGWIRTYQLDPWYLPTLVNIITDHRTFVLETTMERTLRSEFKQNRKKMGIKGHIPPPYYTLRLRQQVIHEKVRKTHPQPRGPKTYRTDVTAHERCRIRRGPLPIDAELAADLRERGYTIFTTNQLDAETYARLSRRSLAYKRADEWLAIKVSWIVEHMSVKDDSLPYVPAVRKFGKDVRTDPVPVTGSWADDPASN